jgi:HTH-type transcriptional regulator/antitoxin HigA
MTTTDDLRPAVAFPPGEYLADELAERGWSVAEFAAILGRPPQAVSEIINGRKEITPATALEIAAATHTAAETWLRLQNTYRLWKLAQDNPSASKVRDVRRRAQLAELVPMRELIKRKIVPDTGLSAQERAVRDLLGVSSLDEVPRFAMAARRTNQRAALTPPQVAWLACVRRAAGQLHVAPFDPAGLLAVAERLTRTVRQPADLVRLPKRFAEVGVRLVHVARFDKSKIDGAAYRDGDGPVIALSGRIARFDSLLFTLLHEIAHIHAGHVGYVIDDDIESPSTTASEAAADGLANRWALAEPLIINAPISRAKVLGCAERLGVHPAVVVGRLHHDGSLPWSHLNNLVPNARAYLESW